MDATISKSLESFENSLVQKPGNNKYSYPSMLEDEDRPTS